MAAITVKALDEVTFEVTVVDRSTTTHMVTVQPTYADKLTGGRVPVVRLVELSFEFLLERESNTSILRQFDLPLIPHYFPEYEQVIRKLL
jgi:hypothetical protein